MRDASNPASRPFQRIYPGDSVSVAEAGLQASRLQSTGRAHFQGLRPCWMRDASNPASRPFQRIYPGIPYLWRKLDCRRLACRARDVLIFKAFGLAGCETHPIQQAGHFSGVQQISSINQFNKSGFHRRWRKLAFSSDQFLIAKGKGFIQGSSFRKLELRELVL